MSENQNPHKLSLLLSFLPLAVLVALLAITIYLLGGDALSGGSQVCLLIAAGICVCIGMGVLHKPWVEFEEAMVRNISGVGTAIIILLIIGALSGAWVVSGVVPTLIYYGVQVIHPDFFLLCTCVICAVVSVMTGSSWTTIATVGIALMGIGKAQGFSEGWIAGAIISGAYFGDKVSPLSDTTVLASSTSGTPLFTHIRYLMYTTVPSMVVALVIFAVAGLTSEVSDTSQIALFTEALQAKFVITPWLLAVPVATGILIARRVSSIITLFVSALLAMFFAVILQPHLLQEIGAGEKPTFMVFNKIDAYKYVEQDEFDLGPKKRENYSLVELKNSWMYKENTPAIFISAKEKLHIDKLRNDLYKMVAEIHAGRYPFDNFLW